MFPVLAGNSASTGYNLQRSLRLRKSAGANLSRTLAASGNTKTWTVRFLLKRGELGTSQYLYGSLPNGSNDEYIYFDANNKLNYEFYNAGVLQAQFITSKVYRDPSAFYDIQLAKDNNQATASNRIKVYDNGVQITAFDTVTYPSSSSTGYINDNTAPQKIGTLGATGSGYFDGYLCEFYFIDGQQLTPSSFGSTNTLTGVWQPARYTGTYGTNGFYLPFTDNSALTTSSNVGLGKDFSGNGNYWTTNNISITTGVTYDSMTDVPTLTSATTANFCVMNPIDTSGSGSTGIVASGGNLNLAGASSDWGAARATFGMSSGKWYWECTRTGASSVMFGIGLNSTTLTYAYTSTSYSYFSTGDKYSNNVSAAYGASFASGDVIGVAFDADAGTLTFYKNGTSQGTAYTGLTSGPYFPLNQSYTTTGTSSINFGQRPFSYTPPTGFVALNTYNLPTSTILAGNKVMDATLFTATSGANTITNAGGFKPDLVWTKSRSNAQNNYLVDSVRGGTSLLVSNSTNAESIYSTPAWITSFNSNGYSTDTASMITTGYTYVGWQWQAGQGSTSSNTNGSITSTVSVNASAGFSVVTYSGNNTSGATVGHGLGVAPAFNIVFARNNAGADHRVYHQSLGATKNLKLNTTDGVFTQTAIWNDTAPTSSVFSLGNDTGVNGSYNYVAYLWTPIAGFSAFGTYVGNGSTSGPFVYCGFQPKFILIKSTTAARDWIIWDTARNTFNIGTAGVLFPDTNGAEYSGGGAYSVAVTSNGFFLPVATTNLNASGETHIYAAFASNPFKNSLAF
jgi:hypothetical protein